MDSLFNFIFDVFICLFVAFIIASVLTAIVDINMKKFFKKVGINTETQKVGFLIELKEKGKDQKEYEKYLKKIQLFFTIIVFITFYYIYTNT